MQAQFHSRPIAFLKRWLFPCCFVLWFLQIQLQSSVLESFLGIPVSPLYKVAKLAVLALLLVQVLFLQTYSRKQLVAVALLTAVFAVSSWQAELKGLLLMWLFMVAARDQNADELVKAGYLAMLAMTAYILCAFFLGYAEDIPTVRESNGTLRHTWGYCHPNSLGVMIMQLAASRLYLHRRNLGLEDLIVTAGAAVFVYAVPNSQSAVICILLLLVLTVVCMLRPVLPRKLQNIMMHCMIPAAVFCNLFTVISSLAYRSGGWLEKINMLLTDRLSSANQICSVYGISLFGQPLAPMYTQAEHNGQSFWMPWLDSSYMNLLLRYGLITYLVYSALYLLGMHRVRKSGNMMLLGILAVIAAHAVMEPSLYDLWYGFFPIVMFAVLPTREENEIPSQNLTGT